ncbi:MAG: heat-inducible transcriptional repressor HrcA [Simkaniaceae bacterium]
MVQKKATKQERERQVLLGLVQLYLQSGRPIGSNTLRENGFHHLSSATIRNYFAKLEKFGYLEQQHSSGGRIPTDLAYKLFAHTYRNEGKIAKEDNEFLKNELEYETKEIGRYLQHACETLSKITKSAVFLSSPRFDQDFIVSVKLVGIDYHRCLCVILTNFGFVHTEVLHSPIRIREHFLRRIEAYFRYRLTGLDEPVLDQEEETVALQFYNEIFLRHIASYTHFTTDDLYKTGFSKLLNYPEFHETKALANSLALFESDENLNMLLHDGLKEGNVKFWIGEDLEPYTPPPVSSALVSIPYAIHQKNVGTVAVLGPPRMNYRRVFGILRAFSAYLSDSLTKSLFKFTISYREPRSHEIPLQNKEPPCLQIKPYLLLEDQREG